MPRARILSEQDIRKAMAVTKSNMGAAAFHDMDLRTYRKYAKLYIDKETGLSLYILHRNQCGKGVPKVYHSKGDGFLSKHIHQILEGKVTNIERFSINKFKHALIRDLILEEKCNRCGFCESRIIDYRVPLLINFKDGNKKNWRNFNLELLCYNCYYLTVGDIFNLKQIKHIESDTGLSKRNDVTWDLDPYITQHLRELGLDVDEPEEDELPTFIAYKENLK